MMRWLFGALMLLLPLGAVVAQPENLPPTEDAAPVVADPVPEGRVRLVRETGGHTATPLQAVFTPDGKKLISMAADRTVQVWDVATKERLRVIRAPMGLDGSGGLMDAGVGQPLVLDRQGERVAFCVAAKGDKAKDRVCWSYSSGYFEKTDGGNWTENTQAATFRYAEVSRTDECVELFDKTRTYTIMLYDNRCTIKRGKAEPTHLHLGAWAELRTFVCTLATGQAQTLSGVGPRDFSLDGKSLALADRKAVRLVDITTGTPRLTAAIPSANNVTSLAFSPNGKALGVVAQDAKVYLLDAATLKPLHIWTVPGVKNLRSVSWANDQTVVCRTLMKEKSLIVLDAGTGKVKHTYSFEELWKERPKGHLHAIVEMHAVTGTTQVFVRTRHATMGGARPCGGLLFDWASGEGSNGFLQFSWIISQAAAVAPDLGVAAQGFGDQNEIVLWNPKDGKALMDGKTNRVLRSKVHGVDSGYAGFRWPSDKIVLLKRLPNRHPAELDFTSLTLKPISLDVFKEQSQKIADLIRGAEPPKKNWVDRAMYARGLLHEWQRLSLVYKPWPKLEVIGGAQAAPLGFVGPVIYWDPTFVTGGRIVVSTFGNPVLQVFDSATGKRLHVTRVANSEVKCIAVSPDRRLVLVGSLDQTLTIFNPATGKVLLTIFPTGADWIAWTPEGYYAGTPGGERHVGWHVENGPDRLASFYPVERFRKTFYRPDVIQRILETGSVEAALKAADAGRGQAPSDVKIENVLPPHAVLTVLDQSKLPAVTLKVHAEGSGKKQPVTALRLLVDGRPLPEGAAHQKFGQGQEKAEAEWSITLPPGKHQMTVLARCADSSSTSNTVEVAVTDPAKQNALHVLAIGVSDYEERTLKLDYAAKDAQDIAANFVKCCKGELFTEVHGGTLVNAKARKDAVLKQLAEVRKQAKPNDLVVVFFAGHGVKEKDKFYLLTVEANPADLAKTALSGEDLRKALGEFPCQVLLMLDACHSSGSLKNFRPAVDDLTRNLTDDECGVAVLCAAMAHEKALEKGGNGLFTKAIVDGLNRGEGVPYNISNYRFYIHHLHAYVFDRVSDQSGGRQHPFLSLPWVVESFPVAQFAGK